MSKKTVLQIVSVVLAGLIICGAVLGVDYWYRDQQQKKDDAVYTLLWTSDPQWYSFKYFDIIEQQNQWVLDNLDTYDIRYTLHTGDFVNLPDSTEQWEFMSEQYVKWDEAGMPYGVLAGNHDVDGDDHSAFSRYFGEARYKDNEWYGESFEDNFGHYDLMTIGDTDYIFVYMGYGSYTNTHYDWLNRVLGEHSDRIAILSFHEYLNAAGYRTKTGELLFQLVVLPNPNVRMVLCGHNYASARLVDRIDDNGDGEADRTLFQMIANYQSTTNGGNGFMRFMECDVENGTITHKTYSPYIDAFGSDYESDEPIDEYGTRDDFVIPFDFSKPVPKADGDPAVGEVVE
ncbi:MAG: hypothetical protein E7553_05180 [Ruminococcaceae bacterium]|nr:hypothetical protein [Oscillospiraceae bacterium]